MPPSAIDVLIADINKETKSDTLIKGSELLHRTYQRATTGALAFDLMLGGGWPVNGVNEIIGLESMGKTTLALKTIAANQALDPEYHTLWVAAEDFDMSWAQVLGVDVSRLTFVMSNIMEEAYEACDRVLSKRAADACVIDSLPALMPMEEDTKSIMEMTVGRGALLTNKFMRKLLSSTKRSMTEPDRNILMLVVNQWRERIVQHGDPRTTPGGKGKNYTYMTRVEVTRDEWILKSKQPIGQTIKATTIKNKTAPPRRTALVDFYFETTDEHEAGTYDTLRQIWDVSVERDVVERHGAWYHFGNKKWNGKDAVWTAMLEDPSLASAIDTEVRRQVLHIEPPSAPKRSRKRVVTK